MSRKERTTGKEFTWSSPWPCSGNDRLFFLTISCRLSWMLSCSLSFSQSHVGPVGLVPIFLTADCHIMLLLLEALLFDRRRGSLLSALELGLNPGSSRIIGRRKNLRPASNPKILEKSLADSQAHQKLCQNWCGVIVVSHLLKIIPCPCNQCSSNKWRVEDAH